MSLNCLPKTPEGAYREICDRIIRHGDDVFVWKILSWILRSFRPLEVDELRGALIIEPNDNEIDEDWLPPTVLIIESCHSLVVHDKESDTIRFAHYTIKEFIETNWITHLFSEAEIAERCLTYLTLATFEEGTCPDPPSFTRRLRKHGFLWYAAKFWGLHTRGPGEDNPQVKAKVFKLINSVPQRNAMLQIAGAVKWTFPDSKAIEQTPLEIAAENGLSTICQVILDNEIASGSQISEPKSHYRIANHEDALTRAASRGHTMVVKQLLNYGVNVNGTGNVGWTALVSAARSGHRDVVEELLLGHADVNQATLDTRLTALHAASIHGDPQTIQMLLRAKVDIDALDYVRETALIKAIRFYHVKAAKTLLACACNTEAEDQNGKTALHCAAELGLLEGAKVLLDAGAECNAQDHMGRTPLFYAAGNGRYEVVKLLLKESADVRVQAVDGTMALHHAVMGNWRGVRTTEWADGEVLPDYVEGIIPLYRDVLADNGDVALDRIWRKKPDLTEIFENYWVPQSRKWSHGDYVTECNIVKELLAVGIDVSAVTKEKGRTPLHIVVRTGNVEAAAILMSQNNIYVNQKDKDGRTALEYAIQEGNEEMVRYLNSS